MFPREAGALFPVCGLSESKGGLVDISVCMCVMSRSEHEQQGETGQ